jgi:hypothetical protein
MGQKINKPLTARRVLKMIRDDLKDSYNTWVLNGLSDKTVDAADALGIRISNATKLGSGYESNVGVWWYESPHSWATSRIRYVFKHQNPRRSKCASKHGVGLV